MGTWPLWIAFNACIALFLFLDQGLVHRRAVEISLRAAAMESALWIGLSLGFGAWIYVTHGRGPGLEFFTGYVVEKSLSTDNVFVFLVVFQYFRVAPRFQHHLLYWGVLGAIVLRGAMIAAGAALFARFTWVPYVLGAFLLYSGFQLFGADHAVHPEKNPLVRWAQKILPVSDAEPTGALVVREGGRRLFTSFFLVLIVLETTDLLLAVDSIAAVFGVTRDPFLVYTSNICAVLGLRALYFLLAGILPYFRFLDEGLAVAVMFVGGKMLADQWLHISTELSLAVVGGIIGLSILASIVRTKIQGPPMHSPEKQNRVEGFDLPEFTPEYLRGLADPDPQKRLQAAQNVYRHGMKRTAAWFESWKKDAEFRPLIVQDTHQGAEGETGMHARLTVGVAVLPESFEKIRAANGAPPLARAPSDLDVMEFELEFPGRFPCPRLDILTTKAPGGAGAIARFLQKFGDGIQQIELDVTDVDRASEILRTRFHLESIYPATRPGADGTRVNFFLVPAANNTKVLVELVEQPKDLHQSPDSSH